MSITPARINELESKLHGCSAARDAPAIMAAATETIAEFVAISRTRSDPEPTKDEPNYGRLWNLARHAMALLGGQGQPTWKTVADYDSERYGPLLGVSDEGSATAAIRRGAYAAPKAVVLESLGRREPLTVGIAHDAERLGAIGEVAVGPDEYATIRLAARDRVLTTTNVGTRVNARLYLEPPEIRVGAGGLEVALAKLKSCFAPFINAKRGLTVFVNFDAGCSHRGKRRALSKLVAELAGIPKRKPKLHRLGLMVNLGVGSAMEQRVCAGIDLAAAARMVHVAVAGLHGDRFDPEVLARILKYARQHKVRLQPRDQIDPQTTARHVWTGLAMARNMGLELGKYGLVPLTCSDQKEVIARIQFWFPHWTAAPVYYIDYPLVTKTDVYHGPRLAEGIRLWLAMVAKLKVRVVLIDTAKKSTGKRLLKCDDNDEVGFLTEQEIASLMKFAQEHGVMVLWAGGVTLPQAFTLGRLGVFGLYVTTAAAMLMPLDRKARRDIYLTANREPNEVAVARVKLLIEAGFLIRNGVDGLEDDVREMLAAHATGDNKEVARIQAVLHPKLVAAWTQRLSS
jgi:hypothetical protein